MELFVINRYLGDDSSKKGLPNEEELKEKLLKKIEERRKHQQNVSIDNESALHCPADSPKRSKKRNADGSDNEESTHESKKVKKKAKKKKKEKVEEEKTLATGIQPPEEAEKSSFLILGKDPRVKKEKVKRVLPQWLANPSIVSVDLRHLTMKIDSIAKLDKIFVKRLQENNILHFFPVQAQVIPWLLDHIDLPLMYWPNDVCISAPTGSGKTLAFVLPVVQALYKRIVTRIRAIVVLPVQDLAAQVFKVFESYCAPTNLKVILLTSKRTFEEEQKCLVRKNEFKSYHSLVDIIVTTPGRLVDHLKSTIGLSLEHLKYLVIDEADRVMENVQNDWLYHLNKHMHFDCTTSYQVPLLTLHNLNTKRRPPQKLLFSATLSQDPEKLQQLGLFHPKLFTSVVKSRKRTGGSLMQQKSGEFIGKFTTPAELKEYFTICTKAMKPLVLHHLMQTELWRSILCFVNSKEATKRLAILLSALSQGKVKIGKLSAKLDRRKRDRMLSNFANGVLDVLVCSDALARGIDIPGVKYVVSYDMPKFVKTYVHRIGRTGRAGKKGTSLSLLSSKEVRHFQNMIQTAGKNSVEELVISEDELAKYMELYTKSLSELKKHLDFSENYSLARRKAAKLPAKKNGVKMIAKSKKNKTNHDDKKKGTGDAENNKKDKKGE